jgi:periplasmic protein TonB
MFNPARYEIEDPHAFEDRLRRRDRRRVVTAFAVAALLHGGTAFAIAYSRPAEPIEPPGEMTITIDLAPAQAETESDTAGETSSVAQPDAPEPDTPEEPVEEVVEETPPEPVEEVVEEPPPEPVEEVAEVPPEPVEEPPPEIEPEPEPEPEPVVEEPPPEPLPEPPPEELIEPPPPAPVEEAEVIMPPPPAPRPPDLRERPKPVEKPRPVEKRAERPRPKPPERARPKPSQASAASAAASSRNRSEVAGSGARATPSEINRYTGQVRAAIERRKRRPPGSGAGTVHVSFSVLASGQITGARISRSSGDPALDRAALSAVTGASVPPIPAGMTSRLNMGVPIRFN